MGQNRLVSRDWCGVMKDRIEPRFKAPVVFLNGAVRWRLCEARHRGGYETWGGRACGAYLLADTIDDALVAENLKLLRKN